MGACRKLGVTVMLLLATLASCMAPALPVHTSAKHTIGRPATIEPLGLGPQDRIRVVVEGHPELSLPNEGARIDHEGRVLLPIVGPVHLAGGDLGTARERLTTAVGRFVKRPSVWLSVVEYSSHRFFVLGQVDSPGAFVMDRRFSALEALSTAGGFAQAADRDKVVLLRPQTDGLEAHVFSAASPDERGLVAVEPGDILFVRRAGGGRFREEFMPYIQALTGMTGSSSSFFLSVQTAKSLDDV